MSFLYRNTFSHLLFHLYEDCWKHGLLDHARFLVGAQILLHVFRLCCIRGHELRTAIVQVKQAHTYFFEYLQQMTDSGFTVDDGKMSTFIYDQVLPATEESSLDASMIEELNAFPPLLALLPPVTDRHVCLDQLQELWNISETETQISSASIS